VSVQANSLGTCRSLLDGIYTAGVESLFSQEILRQGRDSKSEHALFGALGTLTQSIASILPSVLPRIFVSFVQCVRRHRSALYPHNSNQLSSNAQELCKDAMSFFASCHKLLGTIPSSDDVWHARLTLIAIVEKENLFSLGDIEAGALLKQTSEQASSALDSSWKSTSPLPLTRQWPYSRKQLDKCAERRLPLTLYPRWPASTMILSTRSYPIFFRSYFW
jgi:hypothetical protein